MKVYITHYEDCGNLIIDKVFRCEKIVNEYLKYKLQMTGNYWGYFDRDIKDVLKATKVFMTCWDDYGDFGIDEVFSCEDKANEYIKYRPQLSGEVWDYLEREITEEVDVFNFE